MTSYIYTSSHLVESGDGLEMTGYLDFAFVGPGAVLGSSALGGRGLKMSESTQSATIAGQVVGLIGIELTSNGGHVVVQTAGAIAASSVAIDAGDGGVTVENAGTISAYRGIYDAGSLSLQNSGTVFGSLDAVFVVGSATIVNTGLISALGSAIYCGDTASITNYGTISGAVVVQVGDDHIINRGTINGVVFMQGGNDLFDGVGGRVEQMVDLGAGDDVFLGGSWAETVSGNTGLDTIVFGAGDDVFLAFDEDGSDDLDGGAGFDTYDARGATQSVIVNLTTGLARSGGATDDLTGFERVFGGAARDVLTGDAMANTLVGAGGNDRLVGNGGADVMMGGDGSDTLLGGDGVDRLRGGGGRDVLNGGAGDDVLTGGYDVDMATGGSGADRFVWTDFEEFVPGTGGIDRITDFTQGQDKIDLSAMDARFDLAGDQAFKFIGTATITDYGQLSFRTTATATFIAIGFNSPDAYEAIRLDGVFVLSATDFVL